MSNEIAVGGYSIDLDGVRHQLPIVFNPDQLVVKCALERVLNSGKGLVVMRRKAPQEHGPYELEVYVDDGNFLLMLNVLDEDGDHSVKTLTNEMMPNGLMSILGEKYSARAVTRDICLVSAVFNEFAQSGNVSAGLLA
jgi:hypothetical protein